MMPCVSELATAAFTRALSRRGNGGVPGMDEARWRDRQEEAEVRFLRRVLIVAGVVVLALLLWRAADALLLLCAAAMVAVLLRALAGLIGRAVPRLGDGARLALAGGLVLLVLGLAVWLVGDALRTQVSGLVQALPRALEAVEQRFGLSLPDSMQEAASRLAEGQDPGRIASAVGSALQTAMGFGAIAVDALGGLLLAVVGGVFLAADPGLYRRGVTALFPRAERKRVEDALATSGRALRGWLVGQVVAMAVVAPASASAPGGSGCRRRSRSGCSRASWSSSRSSGRSWARCRCCCWRSAGAGRPCSGRSAWSWSCSRSNPTC
jgi:predicted PurR-regulated permease PerM